MTYLVVSTKPYHDCFQPQKRLFQKVTITPPQPLKVKKEGHQPPKLSNSVKPRNPKSRAKKTSLESVTSNQKPNQEEKWTPMKSEKKVWVRES